MKKIIYILLVLISFSCTIQKQKKDFVLFYFNNQLIYLNDGIKIDFINRIGFDFDFKITNGKKYPIKIYFVRGSSIGLGCLETFNYNSIDEFYLDKKNFNEFAQIRLLTGDAIIVEILNTNLKQSNIYFIFVKDVRA
jgi:hypothetical protein